jgi:hypothetical protein
VSKQSRLEVMEEVAKLKNRVAGNLLILSIAYRDDQEMQRWIDEQRRKCGLAVRLYSEIVQGEER